MSYYGAGDYYGAGGIGSFLKGAVRTATSLVTGGPIAAARTAVATITAPRAVPTLGGGSILRPPINFPGSGAPGAGIGRIGTPAHMATYNDSRFYTKDGRPRRIRQDGKPWKRPTMDPGNTKALMRADRRMTRFVGIARSALSHTRYKVVSRTAGGRKKK